jgi:hypothetical protein
MLLAAFFHCMLLTMHAAGCFLAAAITKANQLSCMSCPAPLQGHLLPTFHKAYWIGLRVAPGSPWPYFTWLDRWDGEGGHLASSTAVLVLCFCVQCGAPAAPCCRAI